MKVAMPIVRRALDLAESNPALFVLVASLSVPLALIYAALSFVTAPALNLLAFLVLGAFALMYAGWLARLAITHWDTSAPRHCGG
jgi:hypothetical protein